MKFILQWVNNSKSFHCIQLIEVKKFQQNRPPMCRSYPSSRFYTYPYKNSGPKSIISFWEIVTPQKLSQTQIIRVWRLNARDLHSETRFNEKITYERANCEGNRTEKRKLATTHEVPYMKTPKNVQTADCGKMLVTACVTGGVMAVNACPWNRWQKACCYRSLHHYVTTPYGPFE